MVTYVLLLCYAGNRDPVVSGRLWPVAVCALVRGPERDCGGAGDGGADAAGQGHFSNVEGVGSGVYELKIDFGPGYRVYFGKDGEQVVIFLGGSTKTRQSGAIAVAKSAWAEYKRRKSGKE